MKIFKYIFLLIVLAFFALSVFLATQKGDFNVQRSKVIKSPKATVFNYVNDFRNWENFGSWKIDDPKMQFIYPANTIGKGGSYSWKGTDGDGNVKTTDIKDNETITQKMNYSGSLSDVFWTFKDTVGGTKVTWRSKGTMNFGFKIYTVFKGGSDKVIGGMYERSLENLDKSLDYEMNTYNIKVNGLVKKLGTYYLQQRITSKIANVPKNIRIMLPKLIHFFSKNKIVMHGKPFVIYHTYDLAKGLTDMSVCVPVSQEIFTSPGSDITSGKLESFQAVKTTLTGDYSHSNAAWDKTFEYISKNNLVQNPGASVEMYSVNMVQEKHPSKWVTEIYIPAASRSVVPVKKIVLPVQNPVAVPPPTEKITEP
ncbi:SRPBCC family protein [Flavobacterium noncentrifugens]|uniref:Effector-binding domain-containing protein n=1 Tax=Flavobacterium noncentrifugens TaxID=1128970 RepID=A0A1G9BZI6_9FLAO|nr:GyrI-like domain-containing protein [Flavobacterium noncentrifugens]SDK44594.1 effector-binding domain-containing protein [Flavobacterium noncentrifugens]